MAFIELPQRVKYEIEPSTFESVFSQDDVAQIVSEYGGTRFNGKSARLARIAPHAACLTLQASAYFDLLTTNLLIHADVSRWSESSQRLVQKLRQQLDYGALADDPFSILSCRCLANNLAVSVLLFDRATNKYLMTKRTSQVAISPDYYGVSVTGGLDENRMSHCGLLGSSHDYSGSTNVQRKMEHVCVYSDCCLDCYWSDSYHYAPRVKKRGHSSLSDGDAMRQNVVITGGSGTIGSAIVSAFVDDYNVYNIDLKPLNKSGWGKGDVHTLICDVTDADALAALRKADGFPSTVNHIITVAGGMLAEEWGDFCKIDLSVFRRSIDLNLFGHMNTLHCLFPLLAKASGNKSVTLIGSINGKATFNGVGYSTAKAALNGLMMSLAPQLRSINTRINIVSPGTVVTELTLSETKKDWSRLQQRLLTSSFTTPQDVASLVRCVAHNPSIEARDIVIDSGQLASSM